MFHKLKKINKLSLLFASLLMSSNVLAETYPNKPIRFVVPYIAGGITDSLARGLAELLQKELNQTIIVENKPGANTAVAAQYVANSKPDGYTMLFITPATVVTNPLLNSKLAYNPDTDLIPVARFAEIPLLVVVNTTSSINTLDDLLDQVRQNPGKLNYGSTGVGSSIHLGTLLLAERSNTDMVHIPFNGSSASMIAIASGDIQFSMDPLSAALPLIESNKLQALAVSSTERLKALPAVPTIDESGFPGFNVSSWAGIAVPANTSPDIIKKLNQATTQAASNPEYQKKFEAIGTLFAPAMTPEELKKSIEDEKKQWANIITNNNLHIE